MRTSIRFVFLFMGAIALLLVLQKYFAVTLTIANQADVVVTHSAVDLGGKVTLLGEIAVNTSKSVMLDPFEEGEVVVTVQDSLGRSSSKSFYLSALSIGERISLVFDGELKTSTIKL